MAGLALLLWTLCFIAFGFIAGFATRHYLSYLRSRDQYLRAHRPGAAHQAPS